MRFIKGLKTLLTDVRYNFSFLLSLVAVLIITTWIPILGPITPSNITDLVPGIGISLVVSFQYFMIAMVVVSMVMRERFFESKRGTLNQLILCVLFVAVFMVLGPVSAIAGPAVGAGLAFCDAVFTSFFAVMLGWDIGKKLYARISERRRVNWVLFLVFLVVDVVLFGAVYMYFNQVSMPIENQIVLLMFPLGIVILPIVTVALRNRKTGPEQTSLVALVIFVLGVYYTFRLVTIDDPSLGTVDLIIQLLLLVYGLATTVAKIDEKLSLPINRGLILVLFAILSRVGAYVNRFLAFATGWGPIVQYGITSFTILNLAILGFLVPAIWMWRRRKADRADTV